MKVFYAALAAALVVTGSGCSAIRSCGPGCGDTCGSMCSSSTSHIAPRGAFRQGRGTIGLGLADRMGWTQRGVEAGCVEGCGEYVGEGGCCGSCGGPGCGPGGACHDGVQRMVGCLIDCPAGCGGEGPGAFGRGSDRNYNFTPGPPVGQTAYPYYTVRGPRDFLNPNPRSIGPR